MLKERVSVRAVSETRLLTPAFLVIMLATLLYFIAIGAMIPTLPRYIEGPLGGTNVSVGIVVASFSVAAVLMRPFSGRLADRRGRRNLIIGGAGLVAAATACYPLAKSLPLLAGLHSLTGLGEAFFYVGAASVINDLAPENRRAEALSLFSLALYSGIAIGPVIGETILDGVGFSAVYFVVAGLALGASSCGLLVGDTRAEKHEEGHRRLIHPAGLVPGVVLAASIWGLTGFNTFVPLYALSLGMSGSRLAFVVFSVVVLTIRSLGARLPDRFGYLPSARVSLAVSAAGLVVIAMWRAPAGLLLGSALFAVGQALCFPALMSLALGGAPAAERGAVVGTFTAFFDLAFGLGAVSLGWISEQLGYRGLYLSAAAIALCGLAILQWGVPRTELGARVARARVEESCEPY